MARVGRPPTCTCGDCPKCKRAAYMRRWWNSLTPEQRREKTARRDPERVRVQERRKQANRRAVGTPEQKLRIWARNEVRKARLRGDLTPEPCEQCGAQRAHAHHDDYSKPFAVRWLCRRCHDALHEAAA